MSSSKNFILGLDISSTCSGWCALPLDSSNLRDRGGYGKIITDWRETAGVKRAASNFFERVDWLLEGLDAIVPKYKIVACGSEQLNSFRSGETTRQLAGIQKIAQYHLLKKYGLETNEIHTTTIKKIMGAGIWAKGQGSPKKPDMVRFANARYGLDLVFSNPRSKSVDGVSYNLHLSDDDVADAIGVATTLREEIGAELLRGLPPEIMD